MFHKDLAQKPFPSKYSAQTNQSGGLLFEQCKQKDS